MLPTVHHFPTNKQTGLTGVFLKPALVFVALVSVVVLINTVPNPEITAAHAPVATASR